MSAALDEVAAAAAERLLNWLDGRVDESRREWIAALAAETDEMSGGWEKLRWALSGVTLAWTFRRPPVPAPQAAGVGNGLSRHALRSALQQHRSDLAAVCIVVLGSLIVGLAAVPAVVIFGPIASSLLLFLYARSLNTWRRAMVGTVAVAGLVGALYQMWLPLRGEREAALVLSLSDREGAKVLLSPLRAPPAPRRLKEWPNMDAEAKEHFASGRLAEAEQVANEMLEMRRRALPDDLWGWNYGNASHDGWMILGRVALKRGRLKDAKWYLRLAGRTPGSPQLDTGGPDMNLAKDLLEVGERDTVLAYLKQCRKFWTYGERKMDRWSAEIRDGKIPDFGYNLNPEYGKAHVVN